MNNLPLLKDIHLPEESFLFPLGYGWWLFFALPILAYAFYKTFKYFQIKSKKFYALLLLKNAETDNLESAIVISEVLRRICLFKYKEAVSLFGEKWVEFLNCHSKQKLNKKAKELLVYAPYMKKHKVYDTKDYQNLRNYAKKWIGENL